MADSKKKRFALGILTALIAVVLGLLAMEMLATAYVLVREGRYVTAQELYKRAENVFLGQITSAEAACRYVDTLFPHPYLAFVYHGNPPCGNPSTNNVGLIGDDFPPEKRADRFVVLLTGGSVANQLGQLNRGQPKYLEEALNQRYVSPNGKPFLVLNGGAGAWKQPQQLILLLLHAEAVDAVVTLDGFNEFFYGVEGSSRFEIPANNFLFVNPLANRSFESVVFAWIAGKLAGFIKKNAVLGHSLAGYYVVNTVDRLVQHVDKRSERRSTYRGFFQLPPEWDAEKRRLWQMAQYRKYILAMGAVARNHGMATAHFIQPTPAIEKTLTEEERKSAGDLSYGDAYVRMTNGLLELRTRNVNIHGLLDVFAREVDRLYSDHAHLIMDEHGESRGYRLMAERMAAVLGETWRLSPAR